MMHWTLVNSIFALGCLAMALAVLFSGKLVRQERAWFLHFAAALGWLLCDVLIGDRFPFVFLFVALTSLLSGMIGVLLDVYARE